MKKYRVTLPGVEYDYIVDAGNWPVAASRGLGAFQRDGKLWGLKALTLHIAEEDTPPPAPAAKLSTTEVS